jgi:hypothetical protein
MILAQETNVERFLFLAARVFNRTRIAIEASPDSDVAIKPEVAMPVDVNAILSEAILED